MASALVCLFTAFFGIDTSVHLMCETNRKSRLQFKIPICFYQYCLKLSKGKSFTQRLEFAFFVIWLLVAILVTLVVLGNFILKAFLFYPHSLI